MLQKNLHFKTLIKAIDAKTSKVSASRFLRVKFSAKNCVILDIFILISRRLLLFRKKIVSSPLFDHFRTGCPWLSYLCNKWIAPGDFYRGGGTFATLSCVLEISFLRSIKSQYISKVLNWLSSLAVKSFDLYTFRQKYFLPSSALVGNFTWAELRQNW